MAEDAAESAAPNGAAKLFCRLAISAILTGSRSSILRSESCTRPYFCKFCAFRITVRRANSASSSISGHSSKKRISSASRIRSSGIAARSCARSISFSGWLAGCAWAGFRRRRLPTAARVEPNRKLRRNIRSPERVAAWSGIPIRPAPTISPFAVAGTRGGTKTRLLKHEMNNQSNNLGLHTGA